MEEAEAGVHHAEPLIVSGEVYSECSNRFSEPFLDSRIVDVIVINPIFITCIVGWIDEDAIDFASVMGQECLEREKVIAFNEEVSSTYQFVISSEGAITVVR